MTAGTGPCTACGGTGRITRRVKCGMCNGTGRRRHPRRRGLVVFMVSPVERERIDAAIEAAGSTMTEWVKRTLLAAAVEGLNPPTPRKVRGSPTGRRGQPPLPREHRRTVMMRVGMTVPERDVVDATVERHGRKLGPWARDVIAHVLADAPVI